jgi:hypothetical protein
MVNRLRREAKNCAHQTVISRKQSKHIFKHQSK